jgi:hypothetical protein
MKIAPSLSFNAFGRRPLAVFVILVGGAFAAYEASEFIITGDYIELAYVAIVITAGAAIIGILNDWRNGVYFFLSWLLFEDLVRKYLGNNMAIYFVKDFLLLIVLISFQIARKRQKITTFHPPFLMPLLIFIWYGALQILNPASTSIWYGLMGFKLFFYYVPMMFIGYVLLSSETELRRFFTINLILALVIISLGSAQAIIGPTFLNPSNLGEDIRELSTTYRVAPVSGAIAYRPNSVFVSTGRYADFIVVAWLLVLGFSGYLLLRNKRGRVLAFIAIPVTAAGVFLTASRGTFMWGMINALITSAAFFWGAPWRQGEVMRVLRAIQRAAIGIVLGLIVLFFTYPDALLARLAIYEETLLPSSSANELTHRAWDYPVINFLGAFTYDRWPYGYGIGTTANGGQYVARFFHVKPPVIGVESGFGTLIVEMGIGGLVLWIVMAVAILFSAWKVVKKLKGSPWFPLGFVIFLYSFFLLFPATFGGMQPYEDFLFNAYFWLLLGFLFRLPTLALSAQFAVGAPDARLQRRWIR